MLDQAEEALQKVGKVLPSSAILVLQRWLERGSVLLLDEVPRLLNPRVSESALNPTGTSMKLQFPAFSSLVENTTQIAILIDPTEGEVVLAGEIAKSTQGSSKEDSRVGTRIWSWYPPKTLDELYAFETMSGVRLSPQMRQMYLRMGGCFSEWSFPYWYGPDNLDPGSLYDEIYQTLIDTLHLSDQIVARLRSFVVLSQDGTGDAYGFYRGDLASHDEYSFYQWGHETLDFSTWAMDFAGATQRLLHWRL
jgi:hypothetical protein